MKLRWFVEVDEDGRKTEPELQYWSDFYMCWQTIETIEEKREEHDF
jgi:hypothetical protein